MTQIKNECMNCITVLCLCLCLRWSGHRPNFIGVDTRVDPETFGRETYFPLLLKSAIEAIWVRQSNRAVSCTQLEFSESGLRRAVNFFMLLANYPGLITNRSLVPVILISDLGQDGA